MDRDVKLEKLKAKFGSDIQSIELDRQQCPMVFITKARLVELLRHLKEDADLRFEFLSDLTAYDDQGQPEEAAGRFVVVYNLFSPSHRERLRVKCRLAENETCPTAIPLWKAANWAEREVWDMYGIRFDGHPDLRRIMMDERFEGHPQRKDYYWRKYQLFLDAEPIPEKLLRG